MTPKPTEQQIGIKARQTIAASVRLQFLQEPCACGHVGFYGRVEKTRGNVHSAKCLLCGAWHKVIS